MAAGVAQSTVGVVLVGVLGLLIGSFVNVVAYRVPRGESIVRPPSHCPACGAAIRPWHNVPVVGWLLLRGRCADCHAPISVRYPLVEGATAALFIAVAVRLEQLGLVSALSAYLWLVGAGMALALIDADVRRLPNSIVGPTAVVVAIGLAASAGWRGDWPSLARAGIGAAGLFAFFYALAVIRPEAMGFGDVKVAGVLGGALAYLSWSAFFIGAFAGFLFGALYGVVMIALGRGTRRTGVPFGPFMLLGAAVAVFWADQIALLWTDLMSSMVVRLVG